PHQDDTDADPREDRTGHEEGSEERAVPGHPHGHREDPRDDGVDRDGDRDDEDHQHADRGGEGTVLRGIAIPADRQGAVEPASPARGGTAQPVPEEAQVGDHRNEQVGDAAGQVGRDRQDVPDDRRLPAAVDEDVEDAVGSTKVDDDEGGTAYKRDNGD